MSHRRPATPADKHMERMLKAHPRLAEIDHEVVAFSEEAAMLREMCDRPMVGELSIAYRMQNDPYMLLPEDVSLWSRWRTCKHVYRFDRNLSEELVDTPISGDMPTASLRMLPYPVVFVEARMPTVDGMLAQRDMVGFFVWIDKGIAEGATMFEDSVDSLYIKILYEDGMPGSMQVNLELPTVRECVEETMREDEWEMRRLEAAGALMKANDRPEEATWKLYGMVLNHLLYIVSDTDQEVVYRPSGNSRRKSKCQSTLHEVGVRAGRAIGAAKVRYVGGRGSGEGTVRPHMRSGHWHHFWTGPRDKPDKRKLIVRWVMPTFVNGAGDDGTVTHRVVK